MLLHVQQDQVKCSCSGIRSNNNKITLENTVGHPERSACRKHAHQIARDVPHALGPVCPNHRGHEAKGAAARPVTDTSKSGNTACPSRGKTISIIASRELILKLCCAL